MRLSVLISLAGTAVLSLLLVSASASDLRTAAPPCQASHHDVVCALRPLVRIVKPPVGRVRVGKPRQVRDESVIEVTRAGAANLFLGRAAQCRDLSRTRGGTRLRTRFPETFLLKQFRGDLLCTMADGRLILVKPSQELSKRSRYLSPDKKQIFFASLEADARGGEAIELRIRYYPRRSFSVAVHRGQLRIRITTSAPRFVPAGQELVVALNPDKTIASQPKLGAAVFSPVEDAAFGKQLQLPDFAVQVRGINVSCPSGPGSCLTTVTYTVSNIGRAISPTFTIEVRADPALGVVRRITGKPILPGRGRTLRTTVGPNGNCSDPDCTVEVAVDPDNKVLEPNDGNNSAADTAPG